MAVGVQGKHGPVPLVLIRSGGEGDAVHGVGEGLGIVRVLHHIAELIDSGRFRVQGPGGGTEIVVLVHPVGDAVGLADVEDVHLPVLGHILIEVGAVGIVLRSNGFHPRKGQGAAHEHGDGLAACAAVAAAGHRLVGLADRRTAAIHVCAGLGLAASGQQGEHQGRRQGSAESFHVYSSLHCVSAPALPWLKSRRG